MLIEVKKINLVCHLLQFSAHFRFLRRKLPTTVYRGEELLKLNSLIFLIFSVACNYYLFIYLYSAQHKRTVKFQCTRQAGTAGLESTNS